MNESVERLWQMHTSCPLPVFIRIFGQEIPKFVDLSLGKWSFSQWFEEIWVHVGCFAAGGGRQKTSRYA